MLARIYTLSNVELAKYNWIKITNINKNLRLMIINGFKSKVVFVLVAFLGISLVVLGSQNNIGFANLSADEIWWPKIEISPIQMGKGKLSIMPPINDDPCELWTNPPYDIGTNGSHIGNTCGARGPSDFNADGSAADYGHTICGGFSEELAVWYKFSPEDDQDGYDIVVSGLSGSTEIYWAQEEAGCHGGFGVAVNSDCNDGNGRMKLANCPPNAGDIVYIKVSSELDDCGDFTISVSPALCEAQATNTCVEADIMASPTTLLNCLDENEGVEVSGCLGYACPDLGINDCGQDIEPTVWIKIEIDEKAAQLATRIVGAQDLLWSPRWSIYKGDCDSLILMSSFYDGVMVTCSDGDGSNPNVHSVEVDYDDSAVYYIAVSASNPIQNAEMSFTMNISTTQGCVACVGDADCNSVFTEFEIISRINADGTPSERDMNDPYFCPGEQVRICMDFPYDATESGNDWLHAIIPNFGRGWDYEASGLNSPSGPKNTTNSGFGGDPQWFEYNPDCVKATEDLPNISTYIDEYGRLQICNQRCGNCPDAALSLQDGDPLPAGWFWYSAGSICENDANCPSTTFGIGNRLAPINLCFDMIVRSDINSDLDSENSLNISFQSTSDGITGCYDDPVAECLLGGMQIGPDWRIEYPDVIQVVVKDTALCNNDEIAIPFELVDGSALDIEVFAIENPYVDGLTVSTDATNPTIFKEGRGIINEVLENKTEEIQIVHYVFKAADPSVTCIQVYDTVDVVIYPDITINLSQDTVVLCRGGSVELEASAFGGSGTFFLYEWRNQDGDTVSGDGNLEILAADSLMNEERYTFVVEDDFGCQEEQQVVLTIRDINVTTLTQDTVEVTQVDVESSVLNFYDFLSDPSVIGQWSDDNQSGVNLSDLTSVSFLNVPIGFYNFTYIIENAEPCQDVAVTLVVEVIESDTCGSHPDYAPLMALYNSTEGANWINNTGWIDGAAGANCDPCDGWYGVECEEGRVTCINFADNVSCRIEGGNGNGLKGQIPNGLSALSELLYFDLHNNDISGSIPEDLFLLPKLRHLRLSKNNLTGTISEEIGKLMNLGFLSLSDNYLDGSLPISIGDLINLRYLFLFNNQLSGELPSEYSSLFNISTFHLYGNNFKGCIPSEYVAHCNAEDIDFSNNPLLPWQGDFDQFCSTPDEQIGAPCMKDGAEGMINENCDCIPIVATQNQTGDKLSIYPNPVDEILYIQGVNGYSYSVLDVNGKEVMSGYYENNGIYVGNLVPALYILVIKDGNGKVYHAKIMLKD